MDYFSKIQELKEKYFGAEDEYFKNNYPNNSIKKIYDIPRQLDWIYVATCPVEDKLNLYFLN